MLMLYNIKEKNRKQYTVIVTTSKYVVFVISKHYSQQQMGGNNPNVHQWRNKLWYKLTRENSEALKEKE